VEGVIPAEITGLVVGIPAEIHITVVGIPAEIHRIYWIDNMGLYTPEKCRSSIIVSVCSLIHHFLCILHCFETSKNFLRNFLYALVESR
jgi:hypothetical protein